LTEPNEQTAGQRGELIGRTWAESGAAEPNDAIVAAGGTISDEVSETIESQLAEPEDIANPTAFWEGFVSAVRAYVAEQGLVEKDGSATSEKQWRVFVLGGELV